jgi:hypothetical protein
MSSKGKASNKSGKNSGVNTVTPKAASDRAEEVKIDKEARELYDKLFANKFNVLANDQLLVPNYLQLMCKDKFYKNGGNYMNAYTIGGYAKLMEIPEVEVTYMIENSSEFFVWLHEKIEFRQEVEFLILNLARQLYNDFPTSTIKDKTAALNALAKFSNLQSPKDTEKDDIEDFFSSMKDPDQIREFMIEEMGIDSFDASPSGGFDVKPLGEE